MSQAAREMLAVVKALALGAVGLCALAACGSSGSPPPLAPQPNQRAEAAARHFLDRYVASDGRVVRLDQGGDTVGEGQAYGMLMAAAVGDSQRFNSIWRWTQNNLRRPDRLISFLWSNGRVRDPQAASDADLDASRALLLAGCRFQRPDLRQDGLRLGSAILSVEVASSHGTPVLTAGPWAVNPPITVNPSYFSPATYAALGAASGDSRWEQLATSSRSITSTLMQPPARLPPDWAQLQGAKPVAIGSPSNTHVPPQFSFDAVRTLVRMAEDPNPAGRRIAASAWPVFAGQDPTHLPVNHDLSGRPIGNTLNPVVLVSAAGAADAAGHLRARDGLLDQAGTLDQRFPTYYGAAWVALGRLMLTSNLLHACS